MAAECNSTDLSGAGGRPPNCGPLAEYLEATARAIQCDVTVRRVELKLGLEYDEKRHHDLYKLDVSQFPVF